MAEIGIVHNPNARKNRGDPEKPGRLSEILGSLGIVRETKTDEDITEVAKEYLRRGITILGINGGDGTQHKVISRFINVYRDKALPAVFHLRGGTMNTIANSLGVLRGSTERILKRIVEKYRSNDRIRTIEREVMEIRRNPGPPAEEHQYGFIFGAGFVASFLRAYYEGGDTGPMKAVKVIYRALASAVTGTEYVKKLVEPLQAVVTADAVELPGKKYTVILASTIRDVGLGFKAAYRAGEKEGHFHCVAGDPSAWTIIRKIPTIFRGRPTRTPSIHDALVRTMTIRAANELFYTVDGELFTTPSPLTVAMGPRLKMITG